jgi:hypothetical protein
VRLFTRMKVRDADPSHISNSFSQNLQSNQISMRRILAGPEIRVKVMNLLSAAQAVLDKFFKSEAKVKICEYSS